MPATAQPRFAEEIEPGLIVRINGMCNPSKNSSCSGI
jgi:hypothetical protein